MDHTFKFGEALLRSVPPCYDIGSLRMRGSFPAVRSSWLELILPLRDVVLKFKRKINLGSFHEGEGLNLAKEHGGSQTVSHPVVSCPMLVATLGSVVSIETAPESGHDLFYRKGTRHADLHLKVKVVEMAGASKDENADAAFSVKDTGYVGKFFTHGAWDTTALASNLQDIRKK